MPFPLGIICASQRITAILFSGTYRRRTLYWGLYKFLIGIASNHSLLKLYGQFIKTETSVNTVFNHRDINQMADGWYYGLRALILVELF